MNSLSSAHNHANHTFAMMPTPVLYYPLNGDIYNYASGFPVMDISSGYGHFVNSHPLLGISGWAQCISGNINYCIQRNIPINNILTDFGNGITISWWTNFNNATYFSNHAYNVWGYGATSGTNTNSAHYNISTAGVFTQGIVLTSSSTGWGFGGNAQWVNNYNWHHDVLVLTVTGSANGGTWKQTAYRDGAFVGPGNLTGKTNFITNLASNCNYQCIGHCLDHSLDYFQGYISNFRFYTQPLTADQVTYIYNNKT